MSKRPIRTVSGWTKELAPVLDKYDCKVTGYSSRKNHGKVYIAHKSGRQMFMVCSMSASDFRAKQNRLQECRKICKKLSQVC